MHFVSHVARVLVILLLFFMLSMTLAIAPAHADGDCVTTYGVDYLCTPEDSQSGKICEGNCELSDGTGKCCKPGAGGGGSDPGSGDLVNPLKFDSIEEFLVAVIDVILIFAWPLVVLFIMYAGFLYVTARGDTSKLETARSALMWAVIGGVIVLGATVIMEVIEGTVKSFEKE